MSMYGGCEMMTGYKRVFVDTAPIIYYLENNPMYVDKIKNFFLCV